MDLQEYLQLIQKHFEYLFNQDGFRITQSKENRPGNYSIRLESSMCRIWFEREGGGGVMFIESLQEDFRDELINIDSLIPYINRRSIDWGQLENKPYLERIALRISLLAKEFFAVREKIYEMFSSDMNQWLPSYKKYKAERAKRSSDLNFEG
jgi:hypothetical protein